MVRKDLEPFIGSRARVAEVLNRVRPLSLEMIRSLAEGLKIPADVLVQRYKLTGVEVADFSNVPAAFTRLRVAAQLRCVHPPPAHLRDSPYLVHDPEQVAAAACP